MTIKKIIIFLIILISVSTTALFALFLNMKKSVLELEKTEGARLVSLFLADELMDSVRELTSSVRQFVITGDESFAEKHREIVMIRGGEKPRPAGRHVAPEQLVPLYALIEEAGYSEKELEALKRSYLLSERLAAVEADVINLRGSFYPGAADLVFGLEYEAEVAGIMEPFSQFRGELIARTGSLMASAQKKYNGSVFLVWIVFSVVIVLLGVFIFITLGFILRPVILCDAFARRVAGGDFGSSLEYRSGNEIGSLAASLRSMVDALVERINLKERLRYYDAVISSSEAGIIITNRDGTISNWNAGAESILGYKENETAGRSTFYYTPEEYRAEAAESFRRLSTGESIPHLEVTRRRKDGRLIVCSGSHTPIFDAEGNFNGSVIIFHDITEKKRMERGYREAVRIAEEASKTKTMFLAKMTHEIRTPLNGVIGFTELALDEENASGKTREYLKKIKRSADSLLDVVNGILDISKIESGKMESEKAVFDLFDIMTASKSINELKAAEKGIELVFCFEPVGRKLVGDAAKIRHILINLISNAIKFTESGRVTARSVITDFNPGGVKIMFEVKDTGIGMSGEQLKNVFEPFEQGTTHGGGTGLGLPIAKSFVEIMGGNLSVESSPGLGSSFSFTLPFGISNAAEVFPDEEEKKPPERPFFSGSVLVCEDNAINRDLIINHLEKTGIDPVIAENGREGVDIALTRMENGNPFDLILMDIHMPLMGGLEAAAELAKKGSTTPIAALTANASAEDAENYLRHGMSDCIVKPFTSRELWSCLLKFLVPIERKPAGRGRAAKESVVDPVVDFVDGSANNVPSKKERLIVNEVLNEALGLERTANDLELYREIRKRFIASSVSNVNALNEEVRACNTEEAYRIAHSLKSGAKTIGAGRLAEAAAEMETALSNGDTFRLSEQAGAIASALAELERTMANRDK